jgi:hypothetical protein
MMATPQSTAAMAIQVARVTRVRNSIQPMSAASSGTPAFINWTLATVVWAIAITKLADAVAKHSPTTTPGTPMSRNWRTAPPTPSRTIMKPSRNAAAKAERQKTMVQSSSTPMKRAMAPPVDQTKADRNTSSMPRRSPCSGAAAAG